MLPSGIDPVCPMYLHVPITLVLTFGSSPTVLSPAVCCSSVSMPAGTISLSCYLNACWTVSCCLHARWSGVLACGVWLLLVTSLGSLPWGSFPGLVGYLRWQPQESTFLAVETFQIKNFLLYMSELLIKYLKRYSSL